MHTLDQISCYGSRLRSRSLETVKGGNVFGSSDKLDDRDKVLEEGDGEANNGHDSEEPHLVTKERNCVRREREGEREEEGEGEREEEKRDR